jgi:hypothetical protein
MPRRTHGSSLGLPQIIRVNRTKEEEGGRPFQATRAIRPMQNNVPLPSSTVTFAFTQYIIVRTAKDYQWNIMAGHRKWQDPRPRLHREKLMTCR